MDPVLCTRGALAAAVAMAFAGAAFAGGPGITLPPSRKASASTASSTPASRSITPTAPRAPA